MGYLHGQPGSRKDTMLFEDSSLERFGLRLLSIDRGGYGDTDPAGLDRRDVARDLLTVADDIGVGPLPVLAVSMGGVYALALAALAPDRIEKVVLLSGHVLPYDDPQVVAGLSADEQEDVRLLAGGRTPETEEAYAASVASIVADPVGAVRHMLASVSPPEQRLLGTPWVGHVAASVDFGLSAGHEGYLQDGLRTLRVLEFDLDDVRCPVRAIHGTEDVWEPYVNLQRLAARLDDIAVLALPGLGHFGAWLWPEVVLALLSPEA